MKAIKNVSIQDQVVQSVRSYIENNKLKSGDKLPSQVEMAKILGVSRPSLRESLKKLEAFDVIEVKVGKGVYVKDPNSDPLLWKERERKVIIQALQLRKILEREIIKLVIESATKAELKVIGGYIEAALVKHSKGEDQNEEDHLFHNSLYKSCHSPLMLDIVKSVSSIFELFWNYPLDMPKPFMDTIPLHKLTFDMICEKNAEKAIMYNDQAIEIVINEILNYQVKH